MNIFVVVDMTDLAVFTAKDFKYMKSIYQKILDLQSSESQLVLATVTKTSGSTPQKQGSSALFGVNGLIEGTVGGGIVEGKVEKLAMNLIHSKKSGYFHFNLAHNISETEEAICGGQISVLIDASPENYISVFDQINQSVSNRMPGVLLTMVKNLSDESVNIDRYWINDSFKPVLPSAIIEKLEPEAKRLLSASDPSGYGEIELALVNEESKSLFFLEPVFPPSHLVIAGAGHIGRALAHLGNILGFEVTVIDDRPEYANSVNIPDADHIIVNNIGEAMQELNKTNDTFVVIVTRGHKDDASALKPCIGASLAYTGMIGSKNKIATMRMNFIENGLATDDQWKKVHAPVGLEIKSQTVEEIAVSIAAQLILVRNTRNVQVKGKN